jgi:hypothetical protein
MTFSNSNNRLGACIKRKNLKLEYPKRFTQRQQLEHARQPQTYAATEDDLLCSLVTTWEVVTIAVNNSGNKNEVRKTLGRKYNRQAIDIILHHSKTGRIRDFVVNDSDVRPDTREQLTISNIDLVYYHEHLAGKLRVRLEP